LHSSPDSRVAPTPLNKRVFNRLNESVARSTCWPPAASVIHGRCLRHRQVWNTRDHAGRADCGEVSQAMGALCKALCIARTGSLPRSGRSGPAGAARARPRTASDECVKFSERRMQFSVVYMLTRMWLFDVCDFLGSFATWKEASPMKHLAIAFTSIEAAGMRLSSGVRFGRPAHRRHSCRHACPTLANSPAPSPSHRSSTRRSVCPRPAPRSRSSQTRARLGTPIRLTDLPGEFRTTLNPQI